MKEERKGKGKESREEARDEQREGRKEGMGFKRMCYDPILASSKMIRFGVTRAELRVARSETKSKSRHQKDQIMPGSQTKVKGHMATTQRTEGEPIPGTQSQILPTCVEVGSFDVL